MEWFFFWTAVGFSPGRNLDSFLSGSCIARVMHRPVGRLRYPYVRHALVHHRIFKSDVTYHLSHEKDKHTIPMAWWNGPVLITICQIPFLVAAALSTSGEFSAAPRSPAPPITPFTNTSTGACTCRGNGTSNSLHSLSASTAITCTTTATSTGTSTWCSPWPISASGRSSCAPEIAFQTSPGPISPRCPAPHKVGYSHAWSSHNVWELRLAYTGFRRDAGTGQITGFAGAPPALRIATQERNSRPPVLPSRLPDCPMCCMVNGGRTLDAQRRLRWGGTS